MPDIVIAVNEALQIARNNRHGYSQRHRNGKPDYDCSSLVIHCLDKAGFPMSRYGATYTGNMKEALKKCGFHNVTGKINLKTGRGMQGGDVFLNEAYHTAIAVSSVYMVAAHDNYDGATGDSSGKEINIYKYRNYSRGWQSVWRYNGPSLRSLYRVASGVIQGMYGVGYDRAEALKKDGYDPDAVQALVNDILKYKEICKEVARGKYGNGKERRDKLTSAGYPYKTIQDIVNAYMKGDIFL